VWRTGDSIQIDYLYLYRQYRLKNTFLAQVETIKKLMFSCIMAQWINEYQKADILSSTVQQQKMSTYFVLFIAPPVFGQSRHLGSMSSAHVRHSQLPSGIFMMP